VYAVSQATGQQLWTINAGAPFQPSSDTTAGLAAGDGLLIVPVGNQVVAYTLSTNP
jgi:outer membrane protein assembly factor BamB